MKRMGNVKGYPERIDYSKISPLKVGILAGNGIGVSLAAKGPTTTPRKGDPWPNIESCNVAMTKELDLFANVRPVRVPKQGIDWMFFRENTEDLYALGPYGIDVDADISIAFN